MRSQTGNSSFVICDFTLPERESRSFGKAAARNWTDGRQDDQISDFREEISERSPRKRIRVQRRSAVVARRCSVPASRDSVVARRCSVAASRPTGKPGEVRTHLGPHSSERHPLEPKIVVEVQYDAGAQRRGSVCAAAPCSAAGQSTPPVLQLTQLVIPAPRKPFQVPSGIFLCTPSTLPRSCTGAPPGDVTNEMVNGRHSTSQPPSRKIISLYSGT